MEKKKVIMKIENFSHKDGTLLLSTSYYEIRAALKGVIDLCESKYSGFVRLEISPPYKPRSLGENDKWWAMCTELGNYLGMTKEEVSMGVKYRALEEGLWEGEEMPFSKTGFKKPKSTKDSDTQQMAVLIDVLRRVGAEVGYTFND